MSRRVTLVEVGGTCRVGRQGRQSQGKDGQGLESLLSSDTGPNGFDRGTEDPSSRYV